MKKKLNKLKVSLVIIIIVLAFTLTVFGRYIYNSIRETYLTTQQFYFTSNILTTNGANYQFTNWDGVKSYPIEFDLYSYINKETKLDYDLNYTVTCTTNDSSKIKCTINGYDENATNTITDKIPVSTNTSKVVVYVTPLTTINEGESVKINVEASTSVPYQKTISCEFTLTRETPTGVSYTVEDVAGRDYAVLRITNINVIQTKITLEFDPTELRIDSNDEIFITKSATGTVTEKLEEENNVEHDYVRKFVFNLDAETTRYVKFYKVNKAQNHTYPVVQDESPIKVTL